MEQGGVGDGTVIRFTMRVLGVERTARARITEPDPGRVLVETELTTGLVTTFTVAPVGDAAADVTIETRVPQVPGVRGTVERWITKSMLPRIYRDELARFRRERGAAATLLAVGASKPPPGIDPAALAAATVVASTVMNLDDALTKR